MTGTERDLFPFIFFQFQKLDFKTYHKRQKKMNFNYTHNMWLPYLWPQTWNSEKMS